LNCVEAAAFEAEAAASEMLKQGDREVT